MTKALEAALDVMMDTVGVPDADREITRAHFRSDLKQIIRAYADNVTEEMVWAHDETETALAILQGEYGCKSGNDGITRDTIRAAILEGLK